MPLLVIEHLEDVVTPWVYLEYKHAASMTEDLIITNVRDGKERKCLEAWATVSGESVADLEGKKLVLDPQAPKPLSPRDFEEADFVVVGGIMGDFPPRGRTKPLLTDRLNAEARSLGPCQLSVDGAVYVALQVMKGAELSALRAAMGVILKGRGFTISLPYCYPIRGSEVLMSDELARYLLTLLEDDEAYAAATGRVRSIADYGCELPLPPVEYELIPGRIVELAGGNRK